MARSASRTHYPPALQEALAWLGTPPVADALHDLAPMRKHLAAIADIGIPPLQHIKILELFEARAISADGAVKPLLLDATLPVPKRLRIVAQGLMQAYRRIAAGYLKALREAPPDKLNARTRSPSRVCAAGLASLQHEYEIAQFVASTPGADFWTLAEAFYRIASLHAGEEPVAAGSKVAGRMKSLLALAAGQPEGFSPRELAFLAAYLDAHADAVEIEDAVSADPEEGYWLDSIHGFAPTAAVRRRSTDSALHFRCAGMSRLAREHLSRLAGGEQPESLGLPRDALSADYRDVLTRAAAHWENPPVRQTNRRRHGYRVQVCANLGRLWQHSGGEDRGMAEADLAASEWMVLNESASGYAIMHVSGTPGALVAGSAIGLRPAADKPWSICVVRWARSDNPEHIELGLEMVAPQAESVRIAQRSGGTASPLPALLLPPLAALKRGEALLTARGCFAPGPFTLINETSGHIQVAECAASHLQMHTACIEIFEFERLRIPG